MRFIIQDAILASTVGKSEEFLMRHKVVPIGTFAVFVIGMFIRLYPEYAHGLFFHFDPIPWIEMGGTAVSAVAIIFGFYLFYNWVREKTGSEKRMSFVDSALMATLFASVSVLITAWTFRYSFWDALPVLAPVLFGGWVVYRFYEDKRLM